MENKSTFRDLIVWRKAIDLSKQVYQLTRVMPDSEKFRLTSQMRRAAISIPSNIAEGNARQTIRDYLNFLSVARGSLAELETQIIIADELRILHKCTETLNQLQEVRRILQGLIDSLRRRQAPDRQK